MIKAIHILNGSRLDNKELHRTAAGVEQIYAAPVLLSRAELDLGRAYDAPRGQYRSGVLLAELLAAGRAPEEKQIAVVDVDLFIPVLTFVFGEAQFHGQAAVVSMHRLAGEFYGLPGDHPQLLDRLEKEIVHELGHTAGLAHCRQFECVMRSSTYVEEIDLKTGRLCPACRNLLLDLHNAGGVQTINS